MAIWSAFPTNPTPATTSNDGVSASTWARANRFRTTCPGQVTGIKFHTGATAGTLIVHLWSNTGTSLVSKTVQTGASAGWITTTLTTPVKIDAGTTYLVSVYNSAGAVSYDVNGSLSKTQNGPIIMLADQQFGDVSGVYNAFGGDVFPTTDLTTHPNFWVDIIFDDMDARLPAMMPPWGPSSPGPVGSVGTARFSRSLAVPSSNGLVPSSGFMLP